MPCAPLAQGNCKARTNRRWRLASRRLQAGSACHAQIPARIGQRWAIICGNGVGLEKHSPYASTTGQLGRVVQSNKVYLPQEVPLVSTGLASRRINANC